MVLYDMQWYSQLPTCSSYLTVHLCYTISFSSVVPGPVLELFLFQFYFLPVLLLSLYTKIDATIKSDNEQRLGCHSTHSTQHTQPTQHKKHTHNKKATQNKHQKKPKQSKHKTFLNHHSTHTTSSQHTQHTQFTHSWTISIIAASHDNQCISHTEQSTDALPIHILYIS